MLRNIRGQNTQEHIPNKLIYKEKDISKISDLNVSEIAFRLGFDCPKSFSYLFKNKLNANTVWKNVLLEDTISNCSLTKCTYDTNLK